MIFHDVEQNTPEWDALRLGKVTASKFGVIMANDGKAFGDPAKRYALQVAREMQTGRKAAYSFKNEEMERGHELEPIARMLYEDTYFVQIDNGGFFDCGQYGDSPDGLIGDDGILEIKSVLDTTHWDNIRRGSFDPAYRWQIVGHIDCTERDWCDFASYCGDFDGEDQLIVYRIHRADVLDEIARLRARRQVFIETEVLPIYNQLLQRSAA